MQELDLWAVFPVANFAHLMQCDFSLILRFRTVHGTMDWFKIGKGVTSRLCSVSLLINFYEEYIMQNPGLDETQAGINIAGRNINNHRYADDTT